MIAVGDRMRAKREVEEVRWEAAAYQKQQDQRMAQIMQDVNKQLDMVRRYRHGPGHPWIV